MDSGPGRYDRERHDGGRDRRPDGPRGPAGRGWDGPDAGRGPRPPRGGDGYRDDGYAARRDNYGRRDDYGRGRGDRGYRDDRGFRDNRGGRGGRRDDGRDEFGRDRRVKREASPDVKREWSPRGRRERSPRIKSESGHLPRGRRDRSQSRSRSPSKSPERPNYNTSGALAADRKLHDPENIYKTLALKYEEPEDARKPDREYRLYVFKNGDIVDTLRLDQQSTYLLGRDRTAVDVPLDHPSCSKQHAVIQYRLYVHEALAGAGILLEDDQDLVAKDEVRPYIYDLGSANGTKVNGKKIAKETYVELANKDMIQFGHSTREYVWLDPE
ncbi:SMAD/FHA domain-containing protein [Dipodascopsis tothii]|uniref:SMAD/FHA domain-containing protein n=1 Tax=Dipodascopsis tothii TaxID=44089 RepID=UPI0034CF9838